MTLKTLAASAALAALATGALADDTDTVAAFYDLINNPASEDNVAAFLAATAEDWESVGDYSGATKSRDAFLGQMGGFGQLIPDLEWKVEAMYQAGDAVTVRSRASGTPTGPFFGVDGEGRGFEILAIDVHELEDGVIVRTYHVEDWAGALQQLAGH